VRETGPDKPSEISVFVPRSQVPDAVTDVANHILPMAWVIRSEFSIGADRLRGETRRAGDRRPAAYRGVSCTIIMEGLIRWRINLRPVLLTGVARRAELEFESIIHFASSSHVRHPRMRLHCAHTRSRLGRSPAGLNLAFGCQNKGDPLAGPPGFMVLKC